MHKAAKIYALLGVLLAVCAAAFAVSHYEERREQIKNSGEVILEIPTDQVTALSWTNDSGTFSFTKDETWVYEDDAAFPVDEEKISSLLSQFESFEASFVIENIDDYAQYGLDAPVCTIRITAGGESYTAELGDFSKMDEQRYISIGDGKVYLVEHDPLDEFGVVLRDMIHNDTIPAFDTAEQIVFSGNENYTITRDEDGKSICADDVFFDDGKPLDTASVDTFLNAVRSLNLTNYVSYNVSDEELAAFGLNEPELTIELEYTVQDAENEETSGSLLLRLSRNQEELAAYEEAVEKGEENLPSVTCYVQIGQSQIVYEISQDVYDQLTAVSYNDLRHQALFTADFDTVTSIDVALDSESYTFTYAPPEDQSDEDASATWTYNGEEFDVYNLRTALRSLSASTFTEEAPAGQEEISLTVHLDNPDFPSLTLTLYRYGGTNCLATIDGEPVAFVPRSKTVDLIEAVNKVTLGDEEIREIS